MEEYKCAFASPLITGQFGCVHARPVARRGGPDIVCSVHNSHDRCAQLFERFKAVALPAFGVEDDLLSMPHSTLVKIQTGGLLGLQRLLTDAPAAPATVANINELAETAAKMGLDGLSFAQLVDDITNYKVRRGK